MYLFSLKHPIVFSLLIPCHSLLSRLLARDKDNLNESSISHLSERDYAKPPNQAESQIFLNAIKAEGELSK